MSRLETHNAELRRFLLFVGGFGVLAALSYAVPGTELVRPWMAGEPVPLVHLLMDGRVVVETHPGVLVARNGADTPADSSLDTGLLAEGSPGAPDQQLGYEPLPPPSHALAADPRAQDPTGPTEDPSAPEPGREFATTVEIGAPTLHPLSQLDPVSGAAPPDAPPEDAAPSGDTAPSSHDDAIASSDAPEDSGAAQEVAAQEAAAQDATDSGEFSPDGVAALDPGPAPEAAAQGPPSPTAAATSNGLPPPPRDASLPDRNPARGTPLDLPPGAMDAWFTALSRAEVGEEGFIARALHWGDSTIAGDGITRTVRRRLQGRFGDGGPGFLAVQVDRRWASRPGVARFPEGDWETLTVTFGGADMAYYGLAGTVSTATGEASSTLGGRKIGGERQPLHRFDLFFQLRPDGGSFHARPQGAPGVSLATSAGFTGDAFHEMTVPEGAQTLAVTTAGDGPVTLYGVALETAGPGMTWETLGVAGAGSGSMFRQGKNHLSRQISRRDPHLVVYQMGGNEIGYPSLKVGDGHLYKERYKKVVRRLMAGAPDASCLVVTPLDQGERYRGKIRSKPMLSKMIRVQREAAWELGCGFWNARGAMGGEGAFARWLNHSPPLAWSDLYHLTNRGLKLVGHSLADAMERAYDEWKRRNPQAALAAGDVARGG